MEANRREGWIDHEVSHVVVRVSHTSCKSCLRRHFSTYIRFLFLCKKNILYIYIYQICSGLSSTMRDSLCAPLRALPNESMSLSHKPWETSLRRDVAIHIRFVKVQMSSTMQDSLGARPINSTGHNHPPHSPICHRIHGVYTDPNGLDSGMLGQKIKFCYLFLSH